MDLNRSKETSYTSRPLPTHETNKGGKVGHDVKNIWNQYIKEGPLYDFRKFEHTLRDIKSQGNDASYVEKVREVFMDELDQVKKFSRKFAAKIMAKLGSMNITDSQVLEYVNKQGKKKGLNDYMVEAITREVSQLLADRPNRTPYFRFQPYQNSKIGKVLGDQGIEGGIEHFSQSKHPSIELLEKLQSANTSTHANVIAQATEYTDCAVEALSGKFDDSKYDKFTHIHPVIAALYLPKIKYLENFTIYASIANIILSRAQHEPIATKPDYELYYNMVHDVNESVCDHKDPLNDLRLRAQIQVALWKTILALRSGKYYDLSGLALLESLNSCKYYRYDAADIAYSGDEGDIIRRILMTFSIRPIKIKTLPYSVQTKMTLTTPFVNMELQNGQVDTLPIVNIRLALYNDPAKVPLRIDQILNNVELFYDLESGNIIPKMTQVFAVNSMLVIYVHRRQMVVPLTRFNGPFTFKDLPQTPKDYYSLNESAVAVDDSISINSESYILRSCVCTKSRKIPVEAGQPPRSIPKGCETIVMPLNVSQLNLDPNTCIVYNPSGVNKYLTGNVIQQEDPIKYVKRNESYSTGSTIEDYDIEQKMSKLGVVLVYTKASEDSSE